MPDGKPNAADDVAAEAAAAEVAAEARLN